MWDANRASETIIRASIVGCLVEEVRKGMEETAKAFTGHSAARMQPGVGHDWLPMDDGVD